MSGESGATTLKILLVEDNPGDARLVIELLRDGPGLAPDVRHVTTIAAAGESLADESYDVVLLDLSLPDGNGITTVRRIRTFAPHVPVVVLSGLGDEESAIAAVSEGAQDYLLKSELDDVRLVRSLRYAVRRHERLHRIAYFDSLTDLPNRDLFRDRATQALGRAQRNDEKGALLFIDLDSFKRINDTFGHDAGDMVLRAAADRIRAALRASDIAARHGGDEFTVLLPSIACYDDANLVAQKLLHSIGAPLTIAGDDVMLGASIGIALYPLNGSDFDALAAHADAAMYHAKRHGRKRIGAVYAA